MNTIIETPYYNDFCKWLTNGKPRNTAGKPTLVQPKPAQPIVQRATPAAPRRIGRNKSEAGAAARAFIARCTEPPKATHVAQQFGLSREYCHELIGRKFGKRAQTNHLTAIIAYLKAQDTRPTGVAVAAMFKCSQATASRAIGDVFGKAEPDTQKIAAKAWVDGQTERPRINAVIEKFGVSDYYAKLIVGQRFGFKHVDAKAKAQLEAVAK